MGLAAAGAAGCGSSTTGEPERTTSSPASSNPASSKPAPSSSAGSPAGYRTLATAATRRATGTPATAQPALAGFGLDLLRRVGGADQSTVISPYSLFTVLAMARAGAKGRTASQLDAVLQASGTDAQGGVVTAVDLAMAQAGRTAPQGTTAPVFQSANQTWVQQGLTVQQQFLDALATQFGDQAVAADFSAAPDAMRTAINSWVARRTDNLITELFPPGSIDAATLLTLVNAVRFAGQWATPFDEPEPGQPFTTAAGKRISVPMMAAGENLTGTTADGWSAVTVPYSGNVGMTLLVPDAGSFARVLGSLTATTMQQAAAGDDTRFALTMPPFNTRSTPDVLTALRNLGVTDLFSASADLSGIAGAPGALYANVLVHQAVISVDRFGTQAAAASGLGLAGAAPGQQPVDLTVDRPFVYWISDTTTGAPVFLGTVTDPTAAGSN